MMKKHSSGWRLMICCAVFVLFSLKAYGMQPYENPDFKVIGQGSAPTGVAAFYMIFNYYQDQGIYLNSETGSTVALNQTLASKITYGSQIWNWINNGLYLAGFKELRYAAYKLNDYNTGKAHYVTEMNTNFTYRADSQTRINTLDYITERYLKKNRPVIIHMNPSTAFLSSFYMVLLGYDENTGNVYYACSRDGGYRGIASYDDFINGYFYKTGSVQQARWDGEWLGFYNGLIMPGDYRMSFDCAGLERFYEIHVPAIYDGSSPVPLVLDFHGFMQGSDVERRATGFKDKSEEVGFIVIYPEAAVEQLNTWGADYTSITVDDVTFSVRVVEEVRRQFNIDERRVYTTGLSQGGDMALKCAFDRGDVFAAAVSVSGILQQWLDSYGPVTRNISVLYINSYDDDLLWYYGTFVTPPIESCVLQTAIINGCDLNPSVSYITDETLPEKITTYTNYADGIEVKLYSLHTWGIWGLLHLHDCYETNYHGGVPYVTDLAWEFMYQFTLP